MLFNSNIFFLGDTPITQIFFRGQTLTPTSTPAYANFPRYIFLSGGTDPGSNNLFLINRTASLNDPPLYKDTNSNPNGGSGWEISQPISSAVGWSIRFRGNTQFVSLNYNITSLPYVGLDGFVNGYDVHSWQPRPQAPNAIRGLPASTLDLPSLSVTVDIAGDYTFTGCGPNWNIRDSFNGAMFVWNPVEQYFYNNRDFPFSTYIVPTRYTSFSGGPNNNPRGWTIWGGAGCFLYTTNWGASGIVPSIDDPIYNNAELRTAFPWQGVNAGMPEIQLRLIK